VTTELIPPSTTAADPAHRAFQLPRTVVTVAAIAVGLDAFANLRGITLARPAVRYAPARTGAGS
jgi:hypothetical protein